MALTSSTMITRLLKYSRLRTIWDGRCRHPADDWPGRRSCLPVTCLSRTAGKGVIIRHMVLRDSAVIPLPVEWISGNLPWGRYMISLMSQYTPYIQNRIPQELNRRITSYRNMTRWWMPPSVWDSWASCRKKQCQGRIYSPFDLEGL